VQKLKGHAARGPAERDAALVMLEQIPSSLLRRREANLLPS
jgi:hypothetical protein